MVKQCSISEMRSEETSCEAFIIFNVSFGTCVKRILRQNLQIGLWDIVGHVGFFGSFV